MTDEWTDRHNDSIYRASIVSHGKKLLTLPIKGLWCVHVAFSESSMFITRNRFILKTCGKTTLLAAMKPLLELVYEKCGFDNVLVNSFFNYVT